MEGDNVGSYSRQIRRGSRYLLGRRCQRVRVDGTAICFNYVNDFDTRLLFLDFKDKAISVTSNIVFGYPP